ncbi:MAG: ribonuclease HI [Clostridia bacterium]|nr:ribonuclease HI [Clostridia bacterium]
MKKVTIYTDGACSYNPGPGGYASILMYNGVEKVISGGENETTNNRMEILAVITALKALKEPCEVDLYSDSQYVVDAFDKGWIYNWQNNNWKTSGKSQVKNVELWQELYSLTKIHKINFIKVKGHADNEFNNRCDKIAREEVKKLLKVE